MTEVEMELETRRLFNLLDSAIKQPMLKYWSGCHDSFVYVFSDPEILEGAEHFTGNVETAATTGVSIFFNLDSDQWVKYDPRYIILHELAHCWFLATKKHSLIGYAENEQYRKKCEKQVNQLTDKWFKRTSYHDEISS